MFDIIKKQFQNTSSFINTGVSNKLLPEQEYANILRRVHLLTFRISLAIHFSSLEKIVAMSFRFGEDFKIYFLGIDALLCVVRNNKNSIRKHKIGSSSIHNSLQLT